MRGNEPYGRRILFTSPCGPYPKAPVDADPVDFFYYRNTLGQGIFRLKSFQSWYSLHFLAQNLPVSSVVLENPTMEVFKKEVSRGSYQAVAIGFTVITTGRVLEMVRWLKREHPSVDVILGGYGTAVFNDPDEAAVELRALSDGVCFGEGVEFMRGYVRQRWHVDAAGPMRQDFIPMEHCFYRTSLPVFRQLVLLGALGCTFGCPFCATSSQFARRRILMATPAELVGHLEEQARKHPRIGSAIIYDEDFLVDRRRALEFMHCMERSETLAGRPVLLTVFASIDSVRRYSTEELVKSGIGTIYIGVESFIREVMEEEGLSKRDGDVAAIFAELHRNGINTLGSFIVGWDGHTPENLDGDVRRFVELNPTFYQVVPLHPIPGTPLWKRMREEGRLKAGYSYEADAIDRYSFELKHFPEGLALDAVRRTYTGLVSEGGPWPFRIFENLLEGRETLSRQGEDWGRRRSAIYRSLMPAIIPLAFISRFVNRGKGFRNRWKRTMRRSLKALPLLTVASALSAAAMLPAAALLYGFATVRQRLSLRGEQPDCIRVEYGSGAENPRAFDESGITPSALDSVPPNTYLSGSPAAPHQVP